ncbi:MAG: hypothetical protein MUE52_04410 [Tabrizicola sp.]|nr:hypothetical protein [Tabrizicola sp.]
MVHASGRYTFVPYLGTAAQVDRWIAAGFDIEAAAERTEAFQSAFRAAPSLDAAEKILVDHFNAETRIAVDQGVAEDDPDLYRIATSVRAYEFAA